MKKMLLIFVIFLVTRIPVINTSQIFFDSGEYIARLSMNNFYDALVTGHLPLHSGYIMVFWPIWHAFSTFVNPAFVVILFQVFVSFLGILAFWGVMREIANKRVANCAAILISLTPLFWVSNITFMMESLYVASFFIFLFFAILFLKRQKSIYVVVASIFLFLALMTHLAPLLYAPVVFVLLWLVSKKYKSPSPVVWVLAVASAIAVAGFSFLNAYLLSPHSILTGLRDLFLGKIQEGSPFTSDIEGILRYIRNWLVPIVRNNSSILFLLSILGIGKAWEKNKTLFTIGLLWVLPSLIVNQWSDSLWYGRHALISYFGLAFFASYFISRYAKITYTIILYIALFSIPTLSNLESTIPYLELQKFASILPGDSFYIESHYARPQIEAVKMQNVYFVNEPRYQGDLNLLIQENLEKNIPTYISSQALSDPYGLYSGPVLHLLTLSYRNEPELKRSLHGNFKLKEYLAINKSDNVVIYKIITSDKKFVYPPIPSLKYSKRRIDRFDITRLVGLSGR